MGNKTKRILLLHGSYFANAGDDGQLAAVISRLKKLLPDSQLTIGRISTPDNNQLCTNEPFAPTPHLYLNRSYSYIDRIILFFLHLILLKRNSPWPRIFLHSFRGKWLLFAAQINRWLRCPPPASRLGRKIIKAFQDHDVLYCSGGGNLNDTFLLHELLPRVTAYRLAGIFDKPLILSGQQVGPLDNRLGKSFLKQGLRRVDFIGCRDQLLSRKTLCLLGVPENRLEDTGDDAIDLRAAPLERLKYYADQDNIHLEPHNYICVHVRLHNFKDDFRDSGGLKFANLLDLIHEHTHLKILMTPISFARENACDSDPGDALRVWRHMQNPHCVEFLSQKRYPPDVIKGFIAQSRLLLGFSYHAWLFALSSGVPVIGLYRGSYFAMKAQGAFGWYKRPNWFINFDSFLPQHILTEINNIFSDYDFHRHELLDITEHLIVLAQRPILQLRNILEKNCER